MSIKEFADTIETRNDFLKFLEMLAKDFEGNHDKEDWENNRLDLFLKAMGRYTHDLDGYYKDTHPDLNADIPTWRTFAYILIGARVYE